MYAEEQSVGPWNVRKLLSRYAGGKSHETLGREVDMDTQKKIDADHQLPRVGAVIWGANC